MKCQTCDRTEHEVIETARRFSDAQTGSLKYKTATVYTRCTNCGEVTNYSTTGPLTRMGVPIGDEYEQ